MSLGRAGRRVLIAVACGTLVGAAGADTPVLPSELARKPPACRQGARVIAQGVVDERARRLDARTVAGP